MHRSNNIFIWVKEIQKILGVCFLTLTVLLWMVTLTPLGHGMNMTTTSHPRRASVFLAQTSTCHFHPFGQPCLLHTFPQTDFFQYQEHKSTRRPCAHMHMYMHVLSRWLMGEALIHMGHRSHHFSRSCLTLVRNLLPSGKHDSCHFEHNGSILIQDGSYGIITSNFSCWKSMELDIHTFRKKMGGISLLIIFDS